MIREPDLRRTWLFGPGAAGPGRDALRDSGADALILDLEDFTPAPLRPAARAELGPLLAGWRAAGRVTCVRINALEADGPADLAAAMQAQADVIAYPMAASAAQMRDLDAAIERHERELGCAPGAVEILPVCETARGVLDVRTIAAGSPRIRAALLGAEDLAADLAAERSPEAVELDHARRHFVVACRAAGIEPIDAPYTFSDPGGAASEARYVRRLGYRSKAAVRADHAAPINAALTPTPEEVARASGLVAAFDAARARGEERALFDGLWVEVPTYRNALRLIERARRLAALERQALAG